MATANAIAGVNTDATNVVDAMDEFGRTEAERTIVLSAKDAERVSNEVEAGEHDTFDDALAYVIERGFTEIKRVRDSQAKTREDKRVAKASKTWAALLKLNPSLIADPKVMAKYVEEVTPRY